MPGGCPELASLLEVLTLLQLFLSEVAAHHRVAVLVDAVGEVLAGHADHATYLVLQLSIVDEIPLLHDFLGSTSVLLRVRGLWQRVQPKER